MKRTNDTLIEVNNEDISEDGHFACPKEILSIGESAFRDCTSVRHIELPEGLQSIEGWVFFHCTSLQHITLPQELQSIGEFAFSECSSLRDIELPEGLQSIGNGAFHACSSLRYIELAKGLQSIGHGAFSVCPNLQHITLPQALQSIEEHAFDDCTSLNSIVIPSRTEEDYQRIRSLLPKHLQIVADRTRKEIRVRSAISVLGQASRTEFFSHGEDKDAMYVAKDPLNLIARQLPAIEQCTDAIPLEVVQNILDEAANIKTP